MENEEKQRQRLDKNEEIKETGTLNLNGNGHKANIQLLTIIGATPSADRLQFPQIILLLCRVEQ